MKKLLTLRNLMLLLAAVLGVVAFFVAFGAGIYTTTKVLVETTVENKGLIIGSQQLVTTTGDSVVKVDLEGDDVVHATLSLVGIILMLVGGLGALVIGLMGKKLPKWAILGCAVLLVAGAIMVLCLKDAYISSSVAKMVKEAKDSGIDPSKEDIKKLTETMQESLKDFKLNGATVVSAVAGFVGAACAALGGLMKAKK